MDIYRMEVADLMKVYVGQDFYRKDLDRIFM